MRFSLHKRKFTFFYVDKKQLSYNCDTVTRALQTMDNTELDYIALYYTYLLDALASQVVDMSVTHSVSLSHFQLSIILHHLTKQLR